MEMIAVAVDRLQDILSLAIRAYLDAPLGEDGDARAVMQGIGRLLAPKPQLYVVPADTWLP